jgi:hypothetical protein
MSDDTTSAQDDAIPVKQNVVKRGNPAVIQYNPNDLKFTNIGGIDIIDRFTNKSGIELLCKKKLPSRLFDIRNYNMDTRKKTLRAMKGKQRPFEVEYRQQIHQVKRKVVGQNLSYKPAPKQ